MKLFLREHVSLILLQVIQCLIFISLFWLAGFRNSSIILYSMMLSFFFFTCYLVYRYMNRRHFYQRLSHTMTSLDESLQHLDHAPVSQALAYLLHAQYKQYQKQLMQMEDKQEEHLIFIDRWIHQMKTPLSVIDLTAKELDEPESSSIREEIDRLKTGLQTILHMSRLRVIEHDFHIKQLSLNKLVQAVCSENKRLFIRHNVFPKIKTSEDIFVESDEKWLFFMINQFIHNAVKYSAKTANEIIISLYESEGNNIFAIKDFGIGIPKEDIKRIFDAFYTGENGRLFRESTGVGLYLVNEVARYLGHGLHVESTVGEGTTFQIIFHKTK